MTTLIRRFLKDDSGATAIEYGVLVAMVFVVIVSSLTLFAAKATSVLEEISTALSGFIG